MANELVDVYKEVQAIIKKVKDEQLPLLDLSRKNLTAIPLEVFELLHLERLDLYNNKISFVPPEIARLKHLKKLYLSDNLLTCLPPELGDLPELEYISVIENPLPALPYELNKLNKLKNIYVDDNSLLSILRYKGWMAYVIALPEEMRLPIKQYLTFFTEFVRVAKGKRIEFEVRSVPSGLEIQIQSESKQCCQEIAGYMREYLGFISTGIASLKWTVDTVLSKDVTEFIQHLHNQITFLKMQLEHRLVEIEALNRETTRMRAILASTVIGQGANILPFKNNSLS